MNDIKQIPVSNDGESTLYVGGLAIPPGETRLIDERDAPPEFKPNTEVVETEGSQDDPLAVLLGLSIAKLVIGLPDLSDEELARLEAMESDREKPRAGALAEITAERLRRAESSLPGNPELTGETGSAEQA